MCWWEHLQGSLEATPGCVMFTFISESARQKIFHANDSGSALAKVKLRLRLPLRKNEVLSSGCRCAADLMLRGERLANNLPGLNILWLALLFNPWVCVCNVNLGETKRDGGKKLKGHHRLCVIVQNASGESQVFSHLSAVWLLRLHWYWHILQCDAAQGNNCLLGAGALR